LAKRQEAMAALPSNRILNLALGLPLRNRAELENLLQQLYDPASPNYRQYLTPQEFAERYGPSEQDYAAVIAWAKSNGLIVTTLHPNRVVLDVQGSVADIQRALKVNLKLYNHPKEARQFYAPDGDPSLDLGVAIETIEGLENYALPRPQLQIKPLGQGSNPSPQSGSGPSGTYRGSDFRAAYVPRTSLTGTGQCVGLLQFDGFYTNDITTYESQASLPNVPLTVVPIDGGVTNPGSGVSEVSLDIEMVASMAPGISNIYVYEAPNPSPWIDLLSRMANDNLAKQLSCSWGGGGPNPTAETIFLQMASQGQSFFNATGDSDAFTGPIAFPSESTNITQVGGTTLTTSGPAGAYVSEKVWNWGLVNGRYIGSSGGISGTYWLPPYQQGLNMSQNLGSTTMRNIPDVALTADNVYVVYNNGHIGGFGGTSCAAPLWAGFMALANQQAAFNGMSPIGFVNPPLYNLGKGASYASTFHDITNGNNFTSISPTHFPAVPGYDLCTGWGTPGGTNLINALAGTPITWTLTLNASPSTGIWVSVNPPDNNGQANGTTPFSRIYTNNAVVTLTAPGSTNGNVFQKWQRDGADWASTASTTVTMNGNHTMSAIYTPAPTSYYVTGIAPGSVHNNYSGFVGMRITVGANPVTVVALGRFMLSGNSATHTVKLVDGATRLDITGAAVSLAMPGGTVGQFKYANLSSPIVLAAGASYYLVSQETSGGDMWYYADTKVTTSAVATEVSAVYGPGGGAWNWFGGAGQVYGPVDFQYVSSSSSQTITVASANPGSGVAVTVSPNDNNGANNGTTSFTRVYHTGVVVSLSAPPRAGGNTFQKWQQDGVDFTTSASASITMDTSHTMTAVYAGGTVASYVTGQTLGTVRNSYSGFVGMRIIVGANPVTVMALGRFMLSGNSSIHTVKLVDAATRADVTGGAVSVTMSGGTVGQFKYANLSSPVVLAAGATYYLLSQETSGGDTYAEAVVTTSAVATDASAAYGSGGGSWNWYGGTGQTYGPVDFQYSATPTLVSVPGSPSSTAVSLAEASQLVGANVIVQGPGNHEPMVFRLLGELGTRYTVECSPDLVKWSPLSTEITNDVINIRQTNSIPSQFYRLVPVPGP
jgi:hypothetical protein